jgi:catechol 2,3-dioxygenase-like lactoylglutathione lyase family enzyme
VWRSGLAPYAGTLTAAQLAAAPPAAPREGGFSYVVAPDGVLFEFTGGPGTRDALAHVHLFHERPRCAARWYVEQLGMALPPARAGAPEEPPDAHATRPDRRGDAVRRGGLAVARAGRHDPAAGGERAARERLPVVVPAPVRGDALRPGPAARALAGQALDHVAFVVDGLDARLARLRRAGVTVLEGPYAFGATRAAMIEGPDRLAIELVERRGAPLPRAAGVRRHGSASLNREPCASGPAVRSVSCSRSSPPRRAGAWDRRACPPTACEPTPSRPPPHRRPPSRPMSRPTSRQVWPGVVRRRRRVLGAARIPRAGRPPRALRAATARVHALREAVPVPARRPRTRLLLDTGAGGIDVAGAVDSLLGAWRATHGGHPEALVVAHTHGHAITGPATGSSATAAG